MYSDPLVGEEIHVITGDNGYIVTAYPSNK